MKFLIDSDRTIDFLKNSIDAVRTMAPLLRAGAFLSVISYGEVLEGVLGSRTRASDEPAFRTFLRSVTVLAVDAAVAERFAAIRLDLRQRGLLIPDNDLWIAATAIEHDLEVVTGNRRHFDRVPGLRIHV